VRGLLRTAAVSEASHNRDRGEYGSQGQVIGDRGAEAKKRKDYDLGEHSQQETDYDVGDGLNE
jgi:hypothetical protein